MKPIKRKSKTYNSRRTKRLQKRGKNSLKSRCRKILSKKIGINIGELHAGRYSSRAQAIAVSYSQVKKSNPKCSRYFTKK